MVKNCDYYKKRLQEIREVINLLYKYAINNKLNILNYIRLKFDKQLVEINSKILKEGLEINKEKEYINLANKYIKIMTLLHSTRNKLIIQELIQENEALEIENLINEMPKVPTSIPKIKKTIKDKDPIPC